MGRRWCSGGECEWVEILFAWCCRWRQMGVIAVEEVVVVAKKVGGGDSGIHVVQ
ncbi:hypothetical protein Hanom_Chr12g01094221 [Helianthus anomalus]